MVLLEIAAQGVRGLAPAGGRIALRGGYNVAAVDGPLLRRLLEALLYPETPADHLPRTGPGPGGPAARAGLTVVGNDGVTLRVLRDLNGGTQLQRFDAERRAFLPVSQDPTHIASLLRQGTGVPSQERLAALLALSAADLPSHQAAGALGPNLVPARRHLAPDEARRKLASLQDELAKAQAAEKFQYQLDGLQTRLFKVEELLKAGEQVRERVRAAEDALSALAAVEEATRSLGDPEARRAAVETAAARRDEAVARLAAEREALAEVEARGSPPPFWTERNFFLGLGGAAVAMALAVVTDFRVLSLLAIPAAGYSAFLGLRWTSEAEEAQRSLRRARLVEERERKARESYDRETADVRAVLKALGTESLNDLRDALARLEQARRTAQEGRQRLEEWEGRPEVRNAAAEKDSLQDQIGDIEGKLTEEAGGYVRDTRAVEGEIERLEAELESPPEPPQASAPSAPAGDPMKSLLERAATELRGSTGAALRAVQPRVLQLLPALSAQRFTALLVDERGNLLVQGGGKTLPWAAVAPADRDLCFVALKIGFMEHALSSGRCVAVIDDALSGFGEQVRRSLARLLKQLGRAGQVLHATADPLFREAADHCA